MSHCQLAAVFRAKPLARDLGKRLLSLILCFGLWYAAAHGQAQAGTSTANLTVQITVVASCSISAQTLNFGSSVSSNTMTSAVTQATASISVTCTNGSPFSVAMDNGLNYSSSRRMVYNSTNYISYGLYTDNLYSKAWTTAASSSACTSANSCYLGTGTGSAQSVPVYGQIAILGTAPPAGTYSDTVVMTINY